MNKAKGSTKVAKGSSLLSKLTTRQKVQPKKMKKAKGSTKVAK
jgi:hypothetical protein